MVKNLTEGKPLPLLFFFALPMVAGNLFQQLYNMVDTAVVGKFVGEDAVAAVGSSFPIVFLSVAVASGLSMGCNVVVSQLFGAGRIHEMKSTISTAIISLSVLGLIIMGLGTAFAGPLLHLLGTDPDIMADSELYLQIYFGGAVFLFLYNTLNGIYNAQGDSKTPLYAVAVAALLNVGLETLPLRMARHCENALAVARFLKGHPKVSWVRYPGLEGDPYYERAQKYMPNGTCGVVSFGVKGGRAAAEKFMAGLKLASIATHVADAKTCVLHPASSTHRQMTDEELAAAGVSPDLVRFSVGIEDAKDIIADLEQALANV